MENIDFYQAKTQRIKTISKGIFRGTLALTALLGVLLFGSAALIASTSPALADKGPTMTTETGKYTAHFQAQYNPSDSDTYFYILIMDSSSGRSKMYYGSVKKGSIKAAGSSFNLPSSPL